jgi:hypothetical protein
VGELYHNFVATQGIAGSSVTQILAQFAVTGLHCTPYGVSSLQTSQPCITYQESTSTFARGLPTRRVLSNSRHRRFERGPNLGLICCYRAPLYGVAYKPASRALPTRRVHPLLHVAYLPGEYCPTNPWRSLFGA